jgi:hypothetical protein
MRKSIHIATLLAAFGLLGLTRGWAQDTGGKEPALQPASLIVAPVQTDTANVASPNPDAQPSNPLNSGGKTCRLQANASSAGALPARTKGAQPKTLGTPISCRKTCGTDNLCYYCCLHPDPSHCY